jgi:hypothetical protein
MGSVPSAEPASCRVHLDHAPRAVEREDRVERVVEDGLELTLAIE